MLQKQISLPGLTARNLIFNSEILTLEKSSFNYPKLNRDDIDYFFNMDLNLIIEMLPEFDLVKHFNAFNGYIETAFFVFKAGINE